MKITIINLLFVSGVLMHPFILTAEEYVPSKDLQEARLLITSFGNNLKHALKASMKSDGPLKTIEVCNVEAVPIAKYSALLSSWSVGRTSLKARNKNNSPDVWESNVLQQFEKRKAAGEELKNMEYFEVFKNGEQLVYRYMKPIPTSGLCLTCHGVTVSDNIKNKVNLLYVDDKATGFNLGDIRGAFTLLKTIN